MTVAELIKKLRQYPDDLIVSVSGYEEGYTDAFNIVRMDLILNYHSEEWNGPHELIQNAFDCNLPDDPDYIRAPRLIINRWVDI
jgi:hypothetical protein